MSEGNEGSASGEGTSQHNQELSLANIAEISKVGVKEAVGEVKESLKSYVHDEFAATKTKVIESSKNKFKFKDNKTQYNFNETQKEGVEKAVSTIQKGESVVAVTDLEQVIKDIILS